MDSFFKTSKPPAGRVQSVEKDKRSTHRFNPYGVNKASPAPTVRQKPAPEHDGNEIMSRTNVEEERQNWRPSNAVLNKYLLSNLKEKWNPITHSDLAQRSDVVHSSTSGHQRGERRARHIERDFTEDLKKKRKEQTSEIDKMSGVLSGTNVYIGGYLEDTTDIEMKRILTAAGSRVLNAAPGATHILTSQQLSGSKTHKILTGKSRIHVHVVKPEWVTDSISAGKRLSEHKYSVIRSASTGTLAEAFSRASNKRT